MERELRIGCLVMAAGNARRFGDNKLAATLDGLSLIQRALAAIPRTLFSMVTVVTQYSQVEELAQRYGFTAIRNPHPDWGISHTIALGTRAMEDCDGILYLVSDQPLLKKESICRIVERWKQDPSRIAGAGHDGKRGNPNLFPADLFSELLALREDHGGNQVIRRHEDRLVLVEIPKQELTDCDTPQALEKLKTERA